MLSEEKTIKKKVKCKIRDREIEVGTVLRIEELHETIKRIFLGSDGEWHLDSRYELMNKEDKKC